jgi:folate-binding protein YgfZ
LTPQGKIIADFIVAAADAATGGGFFLDCPRPLAFTLVQRLNFYRLRAKVVIEDLSDILGVLAVWDSVLPDSAPWSSPGVSRCGLCYADPRLDQLGGRCMLPPHKAGQAAGELGAELVDASDYEAHRIVLAIPRGGLDFIYGDAFPHETDMDQLGGIDFGKGCFVGQEVVSRIEHRGTARSRLVAVSFDSFAPEAGTPVSAGQRSVGTLGSTAKQRGLAMLRLDRVADALAAGEHLMAGGIQLQARKPSWARFAFPGDGKAA